jgi:hypothetical protein
MTMPWNWILKDEFGRGGRLKSWKKCAGYCKGRRGVQRKLPALALWAVYPGKEHDSGPYR